MDADRKLQFEAEAMDIINAAIQQEIVVAACNLRPMLALVLAQIKLDLNRDFDRKRRGIEGAEHVVPPVQRSRF